MPFFLERFVLGGVLVLLFVSVTFTNTRKLEAIDRVLIAIVAVCLAMFVDRQLVKQKIASSVAPASSTRIFKAATESKRYAADATLAFILVMRYSGLRISDTTVLARESLTDRRLHLRMAKTKQTVSLTLPDFVVSHY